MVFKGQGKYLQRYQATFCSKERMIGFGGSQDFLFFLMFFSAERLQLKLSCVPATHLLPRLTSAPLTRM